MGSRGLVVLLMLTAVTAVVPAPAGAVSPVISNVSWTPWVPAHGENVTVEADVVSPGGPPIVTAAWCVLPPWTCIPFSMTDPDVDGRYTSPPIFAEYMAGDQPATGAYFNVSAVDPGGNLSFTPKIYVQFASTITFDAVLAPPSVTPGQLVSLGGTALYENNASVPAKFCAVDFEILETGGRWSTTSDDTGSFASSFSAPTNEGSYTVRTVVWNRTISGSQDRYLPVAIAPAPDLAVVAGSLVMSPAPAKSGDTITISVSVENRGTAAAGPFSVLINVSNPSGIAQSTPTSVPGLAVAERRVVSVAWTATEGSWTVIIVLDPGHRVTELSESNNRLDAALEVAPNPQGGPSAILIVGASIVGVGVAAVALLVYRRRAGREKGP